MNRTVKKQFWFNRDEAADLRKKARRTCLSEAALVRLLLRGYEPREQPDDRFYDTMRQLSAMGERIRRLTAQMQAKDSDTSTVADEVRHSAASKCKAHGRR